MRLNKIVKVTCKYLTDANYRFKLNANFGRYNSLSDEEYLNRAFKASIGQELNLDNPKTFNEKLQWLKLYDRRPEYTVMVDKYAVRKYIAEQIGEEYLIPLLGVWDDPEEIDFDSLPDQFVLKCNHNSGLGMCICTDKSNLDIKKVKADLKRGLNQDYYLTGREWPYKDVPRKIIAEKYMTDETLQELRDYKFFCFNGIAKCMKVDFDRFTEHHANYYDLDENLLNFGEVVCPPVFEKDIKFPDNINLMILLAEKLSREASFLRADFYSVDEKIYFGELTFFPGSGFGKFIPEEWDYKLGDWMQLPDKAGGVMILPLKDLIIQFRPQKPNQGLKDYKLWCFHGDPKLALACSNRFGPGGIREDFYDMEWNHLDIKRPNCQWSEIPIRRPYNFKLMAKLAEELSCGIPFVRVDFYETGGKIYFGEMTFYPLSGMGRFIPEEWDDRLGAWLELSEEKQ